MNYITKKIEIILPKTDIEEFCNVCSRLKSEHGYTIEVAQGHVTVCGSSIMGLTQLDESRTADLIIRHDGSFKKKETFKKWIAPVYEPSEGYTAYIVRDGRTEVLGRKTNFSEFIRLYEPYIDDDVEFKAGDIFGIRTVPKEIIKETLLLILNGDGAVRQEDVERFSKACRKIKE